MTVNEADLAAVEKQLGREPRGVLAVSYRPLLFATVDPEVAAGRGVPVRGLGIVFAALVGVTAAQRTWAIGCTFIGWRTALMCHGTGADGGICYTDCRFEGNEVAVHYNTNRTNFFNSVAPDNQFLRNGTAILIEGEPVDQTLGLPGCRFEGNGTDIDNRCGQPLDISQAIFQ